MSCTDVSRLSSHSDQMVFQKTMENPGLNIVVVKYHQETFAQHIIVCMSVSECVQELHTLVLQCTLMNCVFLQEMVSSAY